MHLIKDNSVSAPAPLCTPLRAMTGMPLIRTLAGWRPDLTDCRDVTSACRIAQKSRGQRDLELHAEIADLDRMIAERVDDLAPDLNARPAFR